MTTWEATVEVSVTVKINDENVVDRCVENHDDDGVPQPDESNSGGWRNMFYDLDTREKVIEHLAYNAVFNNCDNLRRLDGWADMDPDAATMHVDSPRAWIDVRLVPEGADSGETRETQETP